MNSEYKVLVVGRGVRPGVKELHISPLKVNITTGLPFFRLDTHDHESRDQRIHQKEIS